MKKILNLVNPSQCQAYSSNLVYASRKVLGSPGGSSGKKINPPVNVGATGDTGLITFVLLRINQNLFSG